MTEDCSHIPNTNFETVDCSPRRPVPKTVRMIDAARPAQIYDIFAIANLHRRFIADTLSSSREQPGLDVIDFYYRTIISRADSAVYVACDENLVIGYASVVRNHGRVLLNMLFANPAVFMKILIQHHMIQWRFIRYMMAKFFHENLGGKWSTTMTGLKNAGELRSVVVQPEYRGLSVGNALLKASVGFTGQNNWGTLIAWVAESNLPSRRLFESAGFSKIAEKMEAHGKVYLYEGCSKGK